MKKLPQAVTALLVSLLMVYVLAACESQSMVQTPQEAQTLEQLEQQEADISAQIELAATPEEKAELQAHLLEIQQSLKEFEAQLIQRTAGPIVAGAAAIHPALAWLSPLAMAFAPLLGKRGRKHAGAALKSVTHGQVVDATINAGRYLGILHTSEETKAVAEGNATVVAKP